MKLDFIKMNPAGNTTIFVLDQFPRNLHGKIAGEIMKPDLLYAEQVGFLEKPESEKAACRLQMMGGEFCGNATRALASLLVHRHHPGIFNDWVDHENFECDGEVTVPLEVSGSEGILKAKVKKGENNYTHWAETPTPPPFSVEKKGFKNNGDSWEGTVVEFSGITHIVFCGVSVDENIIKWVSKHYQNMESSALGIMFYDQEEASLLPLIYVKASDTQIWEGSCGSGSVAVAAMLAREKQESIQGLKLKQPGGKIEVDIKYDGGELKDPVIKGEVKISARGTVYV